MYSKLLFPKIVHFHELCVAVIGVWSYITAVSEQITLTFHKFQVLNTYDVMDFIHVDIGLKPHHAI